MKMKLYLDTWFARYFSVVFESMKKGKIHAATYSAPAMCRVGIIRGGLQTHQVAPLVSARREAERPPLKGALFLVKTIHFTCISIVIFPLIRVILVACNICRTSQIERVLQAISY
jgi:hypothetical protein